MKKRMRFAAMLTSALMLCNTGTTTYAVEELYYFGVGGSETFQTMQVLDDNGTLQYGVMNAFLVDEKTPYYLCTCHIDKYVDQAVLDPETGIPIPDPDNPGFVKYGKVHWIEDQMYLVVPCQDALTYVLRNDIDRTAAAQKAEKIVHKYFPDKKTYEYRAWSYQVFEKNGSARNATVADSLMHELAEAGLISAFYTWGETAKYLKVEHGYLTAYNPNDWLWNQEYDWSAIEAWVKEKHPECQFVCVTDKESDLAIQLGIGRNEYMVNGETFYAVIPPDDIPFPDHYALAMELYNQFGVMPNAYPTRASSENPPLVGQNALAIAGDVNLDCSIDVADAVLVTRYAAEDKEAVITDQGKENADVTHDGNVDDQDAMKILQYIAKKISYEELSADFDPNSVSVPKSTTNDSGSVDNNESENTPTNEVTDSSVLVPIRRTEPKPLTVSEESNKRTCMFREASNEDLALFDDAATVFDRSAYTLICAEISGDFSDAMIVKCISKEGICRTLIAFPYDLNNSAGPHTITYLLAFPKELNIHAEQFQAIWDGLLGTKTVTPQEEFQVLLSDASESIPYISLDRP